MNIQPIDQCGSHRAGGVKVDYETIVETLGFTENVDDDPSKVEASFGFKDADTGRSAFLWCYKVRKKHCEDWSAYGDFELLRELFPGRVREGF